MKKLAGAFLLVTACVGLAFAQAEKAPAQGTSVAETVKQVERDWTDAMKSADADKLNQIIADDWVALGPDGTTETKQAFIADYKSGKSKTESYDFGPMNVKVLGNVAVVQGSDTEKSTSGGKDSSGKYVWMDVFVKRDGKWVAVRSQLAKMQ
jgi:ketosteroid isomerase-like protein